MKLPDGTTAEVTGLSIEGETINAEITTTWPGGGVAVAWVTLAPSLQVGCGMLKAAGFGNKP